jgi:exopolysaccharide biosynthesis polyprenyl glycosylphosphotransferase
MSTLDVEHVLTDSITATRRSQHRLFLAALVVSDTLAIGLALALAYFVRFEFGVALFEESDLPQRLPIFWLLFLIPPFLLVLALFQLYDTQYLLGGMQEYARVLNATTILVGVTIIVSFFFEDYRLSRGFIALCWLLVTSLLLIERFTVRHITYRLRRRGFMTRRTLIVGADEDALQVAEQLLATPTAGAELVGFVADNQPVGTVLTKNLTIVGSLEKLPAIVEHMGVEEIVISAEGMHRNQVIGVFQNYAYSDEVDVRFLPGLFEIFATGVRIKEIGSVPLVSMNRVRLGLWESAIKSVVDYTAAILLLILFSPLLIILAILIKRDSPGPIFHRRQVVGRGGQTFDAFKFRTMRTDGDAVLARYPELLEELKRNHKLKDDPRVTRIGAILRRTSLDELPQLFSILLGQMSLVGPRMITLEEMDKYGKWRWNLLTVKPGITGLWQISGRSDVSYEERVRLDMYYIRNYTLWLDILILWRTVPTVLRRQGAY